MSLVSRTMQSLALAFSLMTGAVAAHAGDYPANNCEFYVNGFRYESRHRPNAWNVTRLDTWVAVNARSLVEAEGGRIIGVGVLGNGRDVFQGQEESPAYWRVSVPLATETVADGGYRPGPVYDLRTLAWFVDVQRRDGHADRLWLTDGGRDFDLASQFAYPSRTDVLGPYASAVVLLSDAANPAPVFHQRQACVSR